MLSISLATSNKKKKREPRAGIGSRVLVVTSASSFRPARAVVANLGTLINLQTSAPHLPLFFSRDTSPTHFLRLSLLIHFLLFCLSKLLF